jgi:septum formation protein
MASSRQPLVLASASPRRAELLRAAGIPFEVAPADVDESVTPAESPEQYARRMAETKARVVMSRVPRRIVLAADTVVVVDHHTLGKPADREDATRMLHLLSGRTHQVITAVACGSDGDVDTRVETTTVEFAPLSAAEIDWYVDSGEPFDKAGAYAIQGLASRFVRQIAGSYSNVVGLPLALVYEMLRRVEQ